MDFEPVIREQLKELEALEAGGLVRREGLNEAAKAISHPNVLVILGVRRCGKSVFSYILAKGKKYGYINFDDERLLGLQAGDLNGVLEAFYRLYGDIEMLILDEVQLITGWELFANRLRRTKKVIVTGSNSKLLSGELATHLTGRHLDTILYPYSFKEYLQAKNFLIREAYTTQEKAMLLNHLADYMQNGGFPETLKFGKKMTAAIYEDIITKDVIMRHKIRKPQELRRLARFLASNTSKEYTYSRLAKILPIKHVATASKWVGYLEEAFLFFSLARFDYKLKEQFLAPKKTYCIDTGIVNSAGFAFSENRGPLMENIIAIELKRRAYREGTELYYWKDYRQSEVDFVVKSGNKITELIQATYASTKEEINERQQKSLIKASKALRCNKLTIITWGYKGQETAGWKKIACKPLLEWLLGYGNQYQ